jgi:hypothetical protein
MSYNNNNNNNKNEPYFELYARIEEEIIMNKLIEETNAKSFAKLFCILIEVVVNVEDNQRFTEYKESCENMIAIYFHLLHEVLHTGSITVSVDLKEFCKIVGLIQCDIVNHCLKNKKMIEELISRVCLE